MTFLSFILLFLPFPSHFMLLMLQFTYFNIVYPIIDYYNYTPPLPYYIFLFHGKSASETLHFFRSVIVFFSSQISGWIFGWFLFILRAIGEGGTEDKMVGWHYQLNGHEFEQTLGDSEGEGSLACSSPWGCKESGMTEQLNNNICWTSFVHAFFPLSFG